MFQVVGNMVLWDGEQVAFLTVPEGVLRADVVDALHEYDPDMVELADLNAMEEERDEMKRRLDDLRARIWECIE